MTRITHVPHSMTKTACFPLHLIRNLPHSLSHTLDLSPTIPFKNPKEKSRIHRVSSIFDSWLKIPNLRCIQAVFQHHQLLWFDYLQEEPAVATVILVVWISLRLVRSFSVQSVQLSIDLKDGCWLENHFNNEGTKTKALTTPRAIMHKINTTKALQLDTFCDFTQEVVPTMYTPLTSMIIWSNQECSSCLCSKLR
ncbi:hypothetical protein L1987_49772 [Smallanthus sonchifolius]|uniref:Uncharacterized protein n=1 Tax=Smallanthus sonchifolius TaxID=185202 RepID=A0ACB9FWN4_9ASTR|nr:hypothetical protein L1987_49772 [Smallanthus sonchifolius]